MADSFQCMTKPTTIKKKKRKKKRKNLMNFREEWMNTVRILQRIRTCKEESTELKSIINEIKNTVEGVMD